MSVKREKIPATIRNIVFKTHVINNKCYCCKIEDISLANFECGHIIAVKDGGENNIDNLRPICGNCNKSMGAKNMYEFMLKYGLNELKIDKSNIDILEILNKFEKIPNKTIKELNKIYSSVCDDIDECLIIACKHKMELSAKYILENAQVNVNLIVGKNKDNAIMYACKNDMPEIAKLILLKGSKVLSRSSLISCIKNNMIETIDLLMTLKLYDKEMIAEVIGLKDSIAKKYTLSKI